MPCQNFTKKQKTNNNNKKKKKNEDKLTGIDRTKVEKSVLKSRKDDLKFHRLNYASVSQSPYRKSGPYAEGVRRARTHTAFWTNYFKSMQFSVENQFTPLIQTQIW